MSEAQIIPQAAVAIIRADNHILLLKRASHPADPWSGHWAFPGGRIDLTDVSPQAAAVRETAEECSIDLTQYIPTQQLSLAHAGRTAGPLTAVAPFLWELPARPVVVIDNREIIDHHWLNCTDFADLTKHTQTVPNFPAEWCYPLGTTMPLWGFTYGIIRSLMLISRDTEQ